MKIAGVIVLYNPDEKVIYNISTYINNIDILYAVDNSDIKKNEVLEKIKHNNKIKYIDNKNNKGIACALNIGAKMALKDGYDWLFTIDQDSYAYEYMLPKMIEYINNYKHNDLGIVSPYQLDKLEKRSSNNSKVSYKVTVMTSGNLLNLKAYLYTGDFNNKLFIDFVDDEYCIRLNLNGYKVIKLNRVLLYHNIGEGKIENGIKVYNYNYIRKYYRIRNFFYMKKKYKKIYPDWFKHARDYLIIDNIIIPMLYERHKFKLIISIIMGYIDFKRNKYGKFKYKY